MGALVPVRSRQTGFTLVEVLLAVAVAALVLVLLFSLYRALVNTVDQYRSRRDAGTALAGAVDQLTRDLMSGRPVPGYDEGGLTLDTEQAAGRTMAELTFCTTRPGRPMGDADDLRWSEVVTVSYRVDRVAGGRNRLLRVTRPLVGPEALLPAQTNVLALGIAHFALTLYIDGEWQEDARLKPDERWPQAARMTIEADDQTSGERLFSTDVMLPVGWSYVAEEERGRSAE